MKSESILFASCLIFGLCSCQKNGFETERFQGDDQSGHEAIVLGRQLDNPYSVENVKSAVASLYSTKAASQIQCTDKYVRFLPKDKEELDMLKSCGVHLLDHPMDFEILRDGDYYHDPEIDSEQITWQYAVVPKDFSFPQGIECQQLQDCFLAENSNTKALPDVDWDAVEAEAFRISGNENLLDLSSSTKASGGVQPSGRITIIDDDYNGGQPLGVSGVRVECNVFVKFARAYTDRDGYYTLPKSFTSKPRYRLVFLNEKGFSIGLNTILYRASVSGLGKGENRGISVTINKDSDRKLFRRSVVNNAVYDYYLRCAQDDLNMTPPPDDVSIWIFDGLNVSSTVMLHHGTVLDLSMANIYYQIAAFVIKLLGPDITLGTMDCKDYQSIYSTAVHEMAHASHFSKVGAKYWDSMIYYIIKNAISGKDAYGDESQENSGICAVGEMWAYYLENRLYCDRYAAENTGIGSGYWFHPQIFTALDTRGFEPGDILNAYDSTVKDVSGLKEKLVDLFPNKKTIINQIFNRYE